MGRPRALVTASPLRSSGSAKLDGGLWIASLYSCDCGQAMGFIPSLGMADGGHRSDGQQRHIIVAQLSLSRRASTQAAKVRVRLGQQAFEVVPGAPRFPRSIAGTIEPGRRSSETDGRRAGRIRWQEPERRSRPRREPSRCGWLPNSADFVSGKECGQLALAEPKQAAIADGQGPPAPGLPQRRRLHGQTEQRGEGTLLAFHLRVPRQVERVDLLGPALARLRQPVEIVPGLAGGDEAFGEQTRPQFGVGGFRGAVGDGEAAGPRIGGPGVLVLGVGVAALGRPKDAPGRRVWCEP